MLLKNLLCTFITYKKVCKKIGNEWVNGKVDFITSKKVGRQKITKTTYVLQFEDDANTKISCDLEEASFHAQIYLDRKAVSAVPTNALPREPELEEHLRIVGGSLFTKWTVELNEMAGGTYVFNATDEVRIRKGVIVKFYKGLVQYELRYKCGFTLYVTVGGMKELVEQDRAFKKCRHQKIKDLVVEAENEWNLHGEVVPCSEEDIAEDSAMGQLQPDAEGGAKCVPLVTESGMGQLQPVAEGGAKGLPSVTKSDMGQPQLDAEGDAKCVPLVTDSGMGQLQPVAEGGAKSVPSVSESGMGQLEPNAEGGAKSMPSVMESSIGQLQPDAEGGAKCVPAVTESAMGQLQPDAEGGAKDAPTTESSCSYYRHAHLIPLLPGVRESCYNAYRIIRIYDQL